MSLLYPTQNELVQWKLYALFVIFDASDGQKDNSLHVSSNYADNKTLRFHKFTYHITGNGAFKIEERKWRTFKITTQPSACFAL